MTNFASVLACIVFAFLTDAAARQTSAADTRAIVQAYLDLHDHLASDRFESVKPAAGRLVAHAVAAGKDGAEIATAARALEAADDIKAARDAFGTLSDAVIARVKADGAKDAVTDLRLAYCPMANRVWLQREAQIRNPYYGSKMPTCGEFKPLAK